MESVKDLRNDELAGKRKAARERKRRSRANQKAARDQRDRERIAYYCRVLRVVGIGELEPDVFAGTDEEWLLCARRFAHAAGLPDVREGESLNEFELRAYASVCAFDGRTGLWVARLLSLDTGRFDERFEVINDKHVNDQRIFLAEHDVPIDLSTLQPLPAPRGIYTTNPTKEVDRDRVLISDVQEVATHVAGEHDE